jgi:hypothetical protein
VGKRSRKRGGSPNPREDRPATPAATRGRGPTATATRRSANPRRARLEERPPAAWDPFPLTELVILVGLVLLAIGFFDQDRATLLFVGFGLTALASGELALREHLAGYRSHSALLGGLAAVLVGLVLAVAGVPQIVVLLLAVAVGGAAFSFFRAEFRRRSGGVSFRV